MARSLPGKFAWSTAHAPALVEQGTADHQLYSQITFKFWDVYLGIVMVYDATSALGHVSCRLSWSADGEKWAWVDKGGLTGADFIPHGGTTPTNTFDSHVCFAAASPVELDDEIRVYYMGGNGPHNGARNSSLGLATLGLDRYAGLAGTGTITTRTVTVTGPSLVISADVKPTGSVRVGAVGLAGLSPTDSTAITADVTRQVVVYAAGASFAKLIGKTVQIEIQLADATVYAVGFA